MDALNYHHLLYFWTVVREGGISKAAEKLRLSQPTISAQIKILEEALGERLFQRQGRTLVLTDVGRVVDRYASEIFTAGSELLETLKGRPSGRAPRLAVGVANAVPEAGRVSSPAAGDRGRRAGADHVQRRRSRSARRPAGHARARRRDQRYACGPAPARQGLQSPAGRIRDHVLRREAAGAAPAAAISHVRSTVRRCCCRRSTRRCGARSNSGLKPRGFVRWWPASSRTRRCSRRLESRAGRCFRRPPRSRAKCSGATASRSLAVHQRCASGTTRSLSSVVSNTRGSRRSPTPPARKSSQNWDVQRSAPQPVDHGDTPCTASRMREQTTGGSGCTATPDHQFPGPSMICSGSSSACAPRNDVAGPRPRPRPASGAHRVALTAGCRSRSPPPESPRGTTMLRDRCAHRAPASSGDRPSRESTSAATRLIASRGALADCPHRRSRRAAGVHRCRSAGPEVRAAT